MLHATLLELGGETNCSMTVPTLLRSVECCVMCCLCFSELCCLSTPTVSGTSCVCFETRCLSSSSNDTFVQAPQAWTDILYTISLSDLTLMCIKAHWTVTHCMCIRHEAHSTALLAVQLEGGSCLMHLNTTPPQLPTLAPSSTHSWGFVSSHENWYFMMDGSAVLVGFGYHSR